eukprot:jgi/Chrpa1/1486/Chrysochromulina_OHIO_Genome00001865-RA
MELVISALELRWHEFEEMGVTDLGILIDWCALWQEPRTQAQSISFAIGLKGINLWYAHQGTTVWLVTEGADRVKGLTYWDKGWTSFEFALAMLIKPANSSRLKAWPQFRETMFQVMGGVHKLNFGRLEWGHEGIKALTVVLPLCRQLRELWIGGNSFGDAGLITLVGTIWAIPLLEWLDLSLNQISCTGFKVFADACAIGALPKLKTRLELQDNNIGDAGVIALATACVSGAMAQLEDLSLFNNDVSDAGVTALARAIAIGALASLEYLFIDGEHMGHLGLLAACQPRGIQIINGEEVGWVY